MHTKTINFKKSILFTLLLTLIALSVYLLSGCWYAMVIGQVATETGISSYNRVIYTDTPSKYATGTTVLILPEEATSVDQSTMLIIETQPEVYDLIINTSTNIYNTTELAMGNFTATTDIYLAINPATERNYIWLNNNHIFSGNILAYAPDGTISCLHPLCVCGFDDIDFGCMCDQGHDYQEIITDHMLTEIEMYSLFEIPCYLCYKPYYYENGDGTFTYYLENECGCGSPDHDSDSQFWPDGSFSMIKSSWLGKPNMPLTSPLVKHVIIDFNELIIDGFDFSANEDFKNSQIESISSLNNWEHLYHPESYTHMFSDLPVEKITIKNVSGLGAKAKDFSSMFENCVNLKTVEFGNLFEHCQPTNISKMFYNCPKIENIDLSTLDTSKVTDMSDMFNFNPNKSQTPSFFEEFEEFINQLVLSGKIEGFDNSKYYTIEEFMEINELDMLGLIDYAINLGFNGGTLTYDQLCSIVYGTNYVEYVLNGEHENGLWVGTDGSIKNIALLQGYPFKMVHDAVYYTNTKDDLINTFINHTLAPIHELDTTIEYSLETYAKAMNKSVELTMLEISSLLYYCDVLLPLSYDEVYIALTGQSYDDAVQELYNELKSAPGGELLTIEDAERFLNTHINTLAENLNIWILDEYNYNMYYTTGNISRGTLNLGGKFVINNNTNIENMFGRGCAFANIVPPTSVGDNVTLPDFLK